MVLNLDKTVTNGLQRYMWSLRFFFLKDRAGTISKRAYLGLVCFSWGRCPSSVAYR